MLKNRYGLADHKPYWPKNQWKSWKFDFETTANYFYIINTRNNKSLAASSNGTIILEDFKKDKSEQLWKKKIFYGTQFSKKGRGNFMLSNHKNEKKVLTAKKNGWLEMKGIIIREFKNKSLSQFYCPGLISPLSPLNVHMDKNLKTSTYFR